MGFTDSLKSSNASSNNENEKTKKSSNKYAKWYGEDWGMGTTKLDDRRVSPKRGEGMRLGCLCNSGH
jgi:hypothetical protein